ncbi:hypothetical protein PENSPDRAFT_672562 [Peniophora sp. CONT]|nr:hypothetical protein PENSPDRAFT_672562 [Peniophora sp. CONT]
MAVLTMSLISPQRWRDGGAKRRRGRISRAAAGREAPAAVLVWSLDPHRHDPPRTRRQPCQNVSDPCNALAAGRFAPPAASAASSMPIHTIILYSVTIARSHPTTVAHWPGASGALPAHDVSRIFTLHGITNLDEASRPMRRASSSSRSRRTARSAVPPLAHLRLRRRSAPPARARMVPVVKSHI